MASQTIISADTVRTDNCYNINVNYIGQHFQYKLLRDNQHDWDKNTYQNLLNAISKRFNLYGTFALYRDVNGDHIDIHDMNDIITTFDGNNSLQLFINVPVENYVSPNNMDQNKEFITNKLKNMGFNEGLIKYIINNNPHTQDINNLIKLCFENQDLWYNNLLSVDSKHVFDQHKHGQSYNNILTPKAHESVTRRISEPKGGMKETNHSDQFVEVWQYKNNGKWMDFVMAESVIKTLDVKDSINWMLKDENFIICRKSIRTGEVMNERTKQKWCLRRIEKLKEIVDRDKIIKNRNKEIEKLNQEINRLEQELENEKLEKEKYRMDAEKKRKNKLEMEIKYEKLKEKVGYTVLWKWTDDDIIWNTYNDEISGIIESLEINKWFKYKYSETDESYKIIKLSIDAAMHINTITNRKRNVKRFEVMKEIDDRDLIIEQQKKMMKKLKSKGQKQKKQKLEKVKEIIDKDKIIEKVKSEKEQFRLKAEEEEKQKLNKEMECQQLKKKTEVNVSWKWLDDDNLWKPYDDKISIIIENLIVNQSYHYKYWVNQQTYKITKLSTNTAIQINIHSKVQRKVKRIEKISGLSCCKYPECWDVKYISKSNYAEPKLIDLPLNGIHAKSMVIDRFFDTMSKYDYEITKVEAVQNQMLYDSYWSEREKLVKLIGESALNEKFLFHGTKHDIMRKITIQGFRKEFNTTCKYGEGTYFAKDAKYSVNYSYTNSNGIYKMFLCKVICGVMHIGNNCHKLTKWPTKPNGLIYDSLVDSIWNPSIYVIHENVRSYPMFIAHFRKK